jgi:predicted NUDIX family NTP pyrophosphohydrolase
VSVYSYGILLFRFRNEILEVMLVHPGGPFWTRKDDEAWSIPEGLPEKHEVPLDTATPGRYRSFPRSTKQAGLKLSWLRKKSGKY